MEQERKQETAKEILRRHFSAKTIHYPGWAIYQPHENEAMIAAIQEIADKAWEACSKRIYQEDYSGDDTTAPDKYTFMKELFPEDIKDTSASG